jgi:hypothetical protein
VLDANISNRGELTISTNEDIFGNGRLANNVTGEIFSRGTVNIYPTFTNYGKVAVLAGTLAARKIEQLAGTFVVANSARLGDSSASTRILSGTLTVRGEIRGDVTIEGGVLQGDGTIQGSLENVAGTVIPGPGRVTLSIQGRFSQSQNGILVLELGGLVAGTESDLLEISGAAQLDGEGRVLVMPSFQPGFGERVEVLRYTERGGVFASVTGLDLASGRHLRASYEEPGGPGTAGSLWLAPVECSGAQWIGRFPTSTSTADLSPSFAQAVDSFIAALQAAGANVAISATYRPPERAYLMHYAYRIARSGLDPATVPAMAGVDICWLHRDSVGNPDVAASITAAEAMVQGYGIVFAPALHSRHTERLAIDMNITWTGNLTIEDGNGQTVTITTTPRTGAGNLDLHAVGATYGVIKLVSDRPHWSSDGH